MSMEIKSLHTLYYAQTSELNLKYQTNNSVSHSCYCKICQVKQTDTVFQFCWRFIIIFLTTQQSRAKPYETGLHLTAKFTTSGNKW